MKTQFEATEALSLRFEPFVNPNLTGAASRIVSGDTLTCTFKAPDASTGAVTMTRDSTTKIWTGSIATGSFQAGLWLFVCISNDASGPDNQYRAVDWGTGITADIPAIKADTAAVKAKTDNLPSDPADASNVADGIAAAIVAIEGAGAHTVRDIYDRLGTPVGASLSADVAAVKTDTGNALTKLGTPAGASLSADVAAVKSAADVAATQATLARKAGTNRDKILGTQQVLYDDDNTTPLKTWNLFDDGGVPSSTRIFERVPV